MDSTTENLLVLARAFASATNRSVSTVSRITTGSGMTFDRLANGKGITTRRAANACQWFSDHWPSDFDWPAGIQRPAPSQDSPAATPGPPPADPVAAVREANDAVDAAMFADPPDWDAARRHEERMFRAAGTLDGNGRIASVEAVCLALGVARTVYDDVVRRYRDGRGGGRPRSPRSDTARVLALLVASGDARFASRRRTT